MQFSWKCKIECNEHILFISIAKEKNEERFTNEKRRRGTRSTRARGEVPRGRPWRSCEMDGATLGKPGALFSFLPSSSSLRVPLLSVLQP